VDFDVFLHQFGENLQRARWASGLTQEQVAAQGITYRHYQELERGQGNPTLQTLHLLAEILDVPVAYMVDTDPKATTSTRERLATMNLTPPKRGRKRKLARRIDGSSKK